MHQLQLKSHFHLALTTSQANYFTINQIAKASSSLTVQCAPAGRYDLVLQARHSCAFEMKTIFHHPNEDWPLLKLIESSKIKYQNRVKKREMVLRWNKSKLDIHAVHYCLAINTKRNQLSLCEAITHSAKPNEMFNQPCFVSALDHLYHKKFKNVLNLDPDPDLVTVSCEGKRNRLTVKGLEPNKRYFIDLFGVHTKLENLTFSLNSTFLWFNRSQPVALRENLLTTFQLPLYSRPAAFFYKVLSYNVCSQLQLFVIPCGGNVRLKITSKTDRNTTALDFHKSSTVLLNSKPRDKFLFKLTANEKFNARSRRKIKVLLSCSDSLSRLPQLPRNVSVLQNFDETDCSTTSISWNPSPGHRRDVGYCIYLIEMNQRSHLYADYFLSNLCVDTSPNEHPHLYQKDCIQGSSAEPIKKNQRINYTLTQLNPNRYYAVHVMLILKGISLPYDKLLINTKSECAFGLNVYRMHHRDDDPWQYYS